MVRAAPSGLRFWLTMDHRINGSSSVCGVCEAYYISPAANLCTLSAIVFFPIKAWMWRHLRWYIDGSAILFWLSRDPYDPDDQRFHHASRRKLCGIKRHFDEITSVCDKLSMSNYIRIYSKHNICSYEFLLRFHDSFAGRLRNQIRTTWLWKIDK